MRRRSFIFVGILLVAVINVTIWVEFLLQDPGTSHTLEVIVTDVRTGRQPPAYEKLATTTTTVQKIVQNDDNVHNDTAITDTKSASIIVANDPNDPFGARDCGGAHNIAGGTCTASSECPASQFCDPKNRKCRPFCVSNALERDHKAWNCNACLQRCPHVQQHGCFRLGPKAKGACNMHVALKTCTQCVEMCDGVRGQTRGIEDVPRASDVWIVSFPKTGSTWLRHLVTNMINSERGKPPNPATFAQVDDFIPFLEDRTAWTSRTMFYDMQYPRIFKVHQPYNCDTFPCKGTVYSQADTQCQCPACAHHFKRIIYVYRNGIATMASYFRFRKGLGHLKADSIFGRFANQRRMYPGTSWGDHIRSWKYAAENGKSEILWVGYEDLVRDAEAQMLRIAAFLGVNASKSNIAFAIDASSKDTMKKMEADENGLSFFKKRYKGASGLQFVDSTTSKELTTGSLWENTATELKSEWMLHNGKAMECLKYDTQV